VAITWRMPADRPSAPSSRSLGGNRRLDQSPLETGPPYHPDVTGLSGGCHFAWPCLSAWVHILVFHLGPCHMPSFLNSGLAPRGRKVFCSVPPAAERPSPGGPSDRGVTLGFLSFHVRVGPGEHGLTGRG